MYNKAAFFSNEKKTITNMNCDCFCKNMLVKTLFSLAIITALGLFSKFYTGPGRFLLNNYVAGLFYVVFFCLLFFLLFQKANPVITTLLVTTSTCCLEFLQLYYHPLLESVRKTFPGQVLIGTTFSWADFPFYFAGGIIGYFWIRYLRKV